MNTVKNVIAASTLALVSLFSTASNAGTMPVEQIVAKSDAILAQAAQGPNAAFNQCVRDNFVMENPNEKPPLLDNLYKGMVSRIALGLVDDDTTFAISVNSILKKYCGDSQLAGDKKSK